MNSKNRIQNACKRWEVDRPPVWVMRQAGRYLPEYRKLKEKHTFIEMVQTPELAMEVTLQPLKRFDLDAAILFSDILVIPEAMGISYSFRDSKDGGGIQMSSAVKNLADVNLLRTDGIPEKLNYVSQAISSTKKELSEEKALIGFCGSPWTLATYMVEGGSSKSYSKIKELFFRDRLLFDSLLNKITDALIEYVKMQIEAGVDVIQIFDSWGGILSYNTFWDASAKYMKRIVETIKREVEVDIPIIVFSKGSHNWSNDLLKTGADVLGVDWSISLADFYDSINGQVALQGNLDPAIMNTSPEIVEAETLRLLDEFGRRKGHIFNLGHGIMPEAKIECMQALVDTITNYEYK